MSVTYISVAQLRTYEADPSREGNRRGLSA